MESSQKCNGCGRPKKLEKYSVNRTKKNGRGGTCKKCLNARIKIRRRKESKGKVKEILAPLPVVIPDDKIRCERDGKIMTKSQCLPGCNDACITCENPQMQNIKASNDTLTPEEHKDQTLSGTYRSSAAIAVEDGYLEK